jgi:hypothetical protein
MMEELMKKAGFAAGFAALVAMALAASPAFATPPSGEADIELACKPVGAPCTNSFQCCSQNCQSVNGKETCH